MQGDRYDVKPRKTDGLDRVNDELLRASWEVDFLAKAATDSSFEGEDRRAE